MIWLTGHTHSGTTMLLSLLDGHPDCLTYPVEPFFYHLFTRKHFASIAQMQKYLLFNARNDLHRLSWSDAFERAGSGDHGLDFDALHAQLDQLASQKAIPELSHTQFPVKGFFKAYYQALASHLQSLPAHCEKDCVTAAFAALRTALAATRPELETGSHPVFKDPLGQFRPGALDWFLHTWPKGKIVFLRREAPARLWSHIQHEKRKGHPEIRLASDRAVFKGLSKSYARDRVHSLQLPQNSRILAIDYEDLVQSPHSTMEKVCGFLGIRVTDTVLTPSYFGHAASPRTNRTGGSAINANSLFKWKDNLTRAEKLTVSFHLAKASLRQAASRMSGILRADGKSASHRSPRLYSEATET